MSTAWRSLARQFGFEIYELPHPDSISRIEQLADRLELLWQANHLLVATDIDGTISPYHPDPQQCVIQSEAHEALCALQKRGATIVAMTGRGGQSAARLLDLPGAVILGTSGWEVYRVDPSDPQRGTSTVHERFYPLADQINRLFRHVFERFHTVLGYDWAQMDHAESTHELVIDDGRIVVERKAVCERFENGISASVNLNRVDSRWWDGLTAMICRLYEEAVTDELRSIYCCTISKPQLPFPACGVTIAPFGEEGKDKSLVQLLRSDGELNCHTGRAWRHEYFSGVPGGFHGAVFLGDSDSDAAALKLIYRLTRSMIVPALGVLACRPGFQGQCRAAQCAELGVPGVPGIARFLTLLASIK